MPMTKHQHLQHLAENILFTSCHICEEAWKLIVDELDERVVNLLFLLFVAAEIEVGLERGLKVESHGAEACTFEVEIKLFVFF